MNWRWPTLLAWCGFLFFYGLSGPLYRTEALRAIIGQSALEGHWLTPTLYGEPFLTKPPGVYAAIGLASWPIGHVTEVSARLPSAIAATLTVLFAFSTLRRFVGERRAFAAAMLLPASILWLDKVPSAEIDILQLAWVSAALLAFLRAVEGCDLAETEAQRGRPQPEGVSRRPRCASVSAVSNPWWVISLLCVTGGFLTKWTAPAFFYLAVVPFLLWRRQLRLLVSREHLVAATFATFLCAVWAELVSADVGWQTLADTVRQEAAQRFAPKANGKPYPFGESLAFPAIVLGATLPWAIPALYALHSRFLRRLNDRERLLVQLLHCWAWPNLLFWSLPAQHHVRYVLPIAPAITLLGVIVFGRWMGSRPRLATVALISAILTWAVVKVGFVEVAVPERTAGRNARETGEQLAHLVPEGETLYLCRLKDEGVLFYYGRPAMRLTNFDWPCESAIYVLMLDSEWQSESPRGRCDYLAQLRDQQQAPIHLVRLYSPAERMNGCPLPNPPTSSPSAP
ncbi:MAG TPA: glycosyltransferase family 39 protein [Gemmataceae bacterium]|jgi:4-amino-4-deoxy-L-arabinose transferase-like glycosyltransferase|nr:glycosyltransferase family 39 protein [Gemmataceae bacterium]